MQGESKEERRSRRKAEKEVGWIAGLRGILLTFAGPEAG